jgi:hypothetical protein
MAALMLWLCIGSLIVLPVLTGDSSCAPRFAEIDLENYDPLNPLETDDDLFILFITGGIATGLTFSESRAQELDFQAAFLSPDSPPPK